MAGFMLLCEIRARQRIRLETILPARGKGFVMAARAGVKYGRSALSGPQSLSPQGSPEALHVWARSDLLMMRMCCLTVQGPVQLLSRGASLIACSAARDSLAAITDALAPPAHPAIASLDGVESFSSTKAVRSDMRAGMLGSLSGKLSSRRLPRESTGDASRASCFPFTSASRSVVRTSGADSTWPGAGLGTPLAWIDR